MTTPALPLSGYSIKKVYTIEHSLKQLDGEEAEALLAAPESSDEDHEITFGWDWRYLLPAEDEFEVKIQISLKPTQSEPYRASLTMIGTFKMAGEPTVPIDQFARLQAVAILLPYTRRSLANLTVNTVSGAFHLPTINVAGLMQRFVSDKTTAAGQIKIRSKAEDKDSSPKRLKGTLKK